MNDEAVAAGRTALGGQHRRQWSRLGVYTLLALGTLAMWYAIAAVTMPIFFPPPDEVAVAFWNTLRDGSLIANVGASYVRILIGWVVGCAIAIPLGLIAARSALARMLVEPYIEFFRFIPPIAFIGLFLIWFGLGEVSKILLIVYTTLFVTFVNTLAGAMAVEPEKIRAAQCLGASRRQIFSHVVVPATVPHIVTGLRLAMGNAFMTVIAAELVAAQSGVGHMIWNSRLFAQTDYVFVGIITLGLMGFAANWLLSQILTRVAYRYAIHL
ncbi:MAG: ABC transporter permease [Vicinamibacterales bacterium]